MVEGIETSGHLASPDRVVVTSLETDRVVEAIPDRVVVASSNRVEVASTDRVEGASTEGVVLLCQAKVVVANQDRLMLHHHNKQAIKLNLLPGIFRVFKE